MKHVIFRGLTPPKCGKPLPLRTIAGGIFHNIPLGKNQYTFLLNHFDLRVSKKTSGVTTTLNGNILNKILRRSGALPLSQNVCIFISAGSNWETNLYWVTADSLCLAKFCNSAGWESQRFHPQSRFPSQPWGQPRLSNAFEPKVWVILPKTFMKNRERLPISEALCKTCLFVAVIKMKKNWHP